LRARARARVCVVSHKSRPNPRPRACPFPFTSVLLFAFCLSACESPLPPPLADGQFAFAVLGDAPYNRAEERLFAHLVRGLEDEELEWVIHLGDIIGTPCTDSIYLARRELLRAIGHPVIYTPGDNEWTDCHRRSLGSYQPLERLRKLREVFFTDTDGNIARSGLTLISQAQNPAWPEFVENRRWMHGGIVFATVHLVGSRNGMLDFDGRTDADDEEVTRRASAAVAWLQETFAQARANQARAVVLATHADLALERGRGSRNRKPFQPFIDALATEVEAFGASVLVVHGDGHNLTIDQPLTSSKSGETLTNLTRIEVLGSPGVGWIRIVADTLREPRFSFQPERVSWLRLLSR